ncbi:MAG: hypothetical protein EZS28_004975 [Streblomastix strix]|uniref:Uncharacterized protein n=1 Tax=Streblomastix strix TaxID=222440 RepID=A0A5J4WYE8_9EUKA|nr:MAG: hypothetical protein EZS28_004975 [Streblomastix strix]
MVILHLAWRAGQCGCMIRHGIIAEDDEDYITRGTIYDQYVIKAQPGTITAVASQAGENTRGLQISADRNTLTFNGRTL